MPWQTWSAGVPPNAPPPWQGSTTQWEPPSRWHDSTSSSGCYWNTNVGWQATTTERNDDARPQWGPRQGRGWEEARPQHEVQQGGGVTPPRIALRLNHKADKKKSDGPWERARRAGIEKTAANANSVVVVLNLL